MAAEEGDRAVEVGSLGGLLGLRIGMIFPTFQMLGILFLFSEWLKMLMRALIACGPKCFMWR